jgi:hypothetical protein
MKTNTAKLILTTFIATLTFALMPVSGAGYTVPGSSIDGGGGPCAGGVSTSGRAAFSVIATVGQPDAGACMAGAYTMQGGLVPTLQKTVGPELRITRSFGAVILTWPAPACAGFRLEGSANVSGGPWVNFGEGLPSGADRFAAVAASGPYQFFRLRKACAGGCPQVCRE